MLQMQVVSGPTDLGASPERTYKVARFWAIAVPTAALAGAIGGGVIGYRRRRTAGAAAVGAIVGTLALGLTAGAAGAVHTAVALPKVDPLAPLPEA